MKANVGGQPFEAGIERQPWIGEKVNGTDDFGKQVRTTIENSIRVKRLLLDDGETVDTIARLSRVLVEAFRKGNKLVLFGNGGSAADAQHIAAEFVGRFAFDRPALAALALSVNSSCVTAIGNDYGFDRVFARQIEALGRSGDVAIGISTSGTSPNVVAGLRLARKMGLHTVALTGAKGHSLREIADFCLCVPADETPRIQECHILIGHVISQLAEQALFHEPSRVSRS